MKVTDSPAGKAKSKRQKAKGKRQKAEEYLVILSKHHPNNPVILSEKSDSVKEEIL